MPLEVFYIAFGSFFLLFFKPLRKIALIAFIISFFLIAMSIWRDTRNSTISVGENGNISVKGKDGSSIVIPPISGHRPERPPPTQNP